MTMSSSSKLISFAYSVLEYRKGRYAKQNSRDCKDPMIFF